MSLGDSMMESEIDRLRQQLEEKDKAIRHLKVAALQCALRAKGDVKDDAKASVLREALAKAAEVFEGYACYHFLKGANEKAAANRAHAKMCRDALAESEVKS